VRGGPSRDQDRHPRQQYYHSGHQLRCPHNRLRYLGDTFTSAQDINERGRVVGYNETDSGEQHTSLWQGGKMTHLGGYFASVINNRGQVVDLSYLWSMSRPRTTGAKH
jgi:probable HAF family extracellular repeat protein